MRSKFSCVRSSHDLCARTRAQLRGDIDSMVMCNGFNTDYKVSEPLKTLVMLCYAYRWKNPFVYYSHAANKNMQPMSKDSIL